MSQKAKKIISEAAQFFCASKAELYSSTGLAIVEIRREGPYVYDSEGAEYIDLRSDSGAFSLGRRPPEMVSALRAALDTYDLGNSQYFSDAKIQLARKLSEISPNRELGSVSYHASGAEAVDFAVKLARGHTRREEILCSKTGYYGTSGFALSASGQNAYRDGVEPVAPGFRFFTFNNLSSLRAQISDKTAAVLLEPIESEGGAHPPSPDFFAEVRDLCDQHRTLLILDEVLTGLGRAGRMFAIDRYGIVPDILTLGKALSGGLYPMAACLYRKEIQEFVNEHPFLHLSTFAGSDLGCAVALKAIQLTERLKLPDRAEEMGKLLLEGLEEVAGEHPLVVHEARGKGLLLAFELRDGALGMGLSCALRKRGVLANFLPHQRRMLRLLPALTIDEADVSNIVAAFSDALDEIASPRRALDLHLRVPDPEQRLVA